MHRTIQRELMGATVAVILVTVVLLGLTVPGAVERSLRAEQQHALLAESELAARLVAEAVAHAEIMPSVRPAGSAGVPPASSQARMRAAGVGRPTRPRSQARRNTVTGTGRMIPS
jgi:hypothetical protein